MFRFLAFIFSIAIVFTAPAFANDSSAKAKGELGSRWTGADGKPRHARIWVEMDGRHIVTGPDYHRFRDIHVDLRRSKLQQGRYPEKALLADQEGKVKLWLRTDKTGKVYWSDWVKLDDSDEISMHARKFLDNNIRFVPALKRNGSEVTDSFVITLHYELHPRADPPAAKPEKPPEHIRPPRPELPITRALLGIDKDMPLPHKVEGFGAWLDIRRNGTIESCTLTHPTDIDALDRDICVTLINFHRFEPAWNTRTQSAEPGKYHFYTKWAD